MTGVLIRTLRGLQMQYASRSVVTDFVLYSVGKG